ncbi:MAG: tRNA lysidine(34) synthetase TilS [Melioribacter sp.]|nr:tRNA lysidine(34) synthetase TilS [Melioribacter sp.]
MRNIEQEIIKFISQYNLINKKDRILIALSGGPDSVFALHFFNKFKSKYKIEIAAIHFNHQLRESEADEDEKFSEQLCKSLNIPFFPFKLKVKEFAKTNKLSIEEAARKLRYEILEKFSDENNFNKIITAHTLNDNTETVLLNLITGTGFYGLTGIPIKRDKIIRPLLCITKDEILDYLHKHNINYRIDSSNLKNDFKRNILRNEILPLIKSKLNPQVDLAIFRSSKVFEDFKTIIDKYINDLVKKYLRISEQKIFIKSTIKKIEDGVFGELLKKILYEYFNYQLEYQDVISLKELLKNQTGKRINLSKNIIVTKERNGIIINKIENPKENDFFEIRVGKKIKVENKTIGIDKVNKSEIEFTKSKNIEYISADKLNDKFILRKWTSGDKFIPLGMKKPKKISDFLTDEKIKSSEKKDKFVLTNKNFIVWVVGLRIDDRFKITQKTKKVLKLWIK